MTDITLHFAPHTCARVPMIALEEIGHPFKTELVAFVRGDHHSPKYLALNPKGKVPVLVVDGRVLTENVAILSWLAARFPHAKLLPSRSDPLDHAQLVSDLAYCASGLHPIVTRLRIPQFFCDRPDGKDRVFQMAETAMHAQFEIIEERLVRDEWWYGQDWSVMDAYLNWIWFRVSGTAFDVSRYPNFARHDRHIRQRPAVQRALQRNEEAAAWLADQGLELKFDGATAVQATQPKHSVTSPAVDVDAQRGHG
jgi:glutathione S-transferase